MEAIPHYYRGPWIWNEHGTEPCWQPPDGCVGLDLRSLPEQSQQGGTPGLGLFVTTDNEAKLGSDYDLIGRGHWGDEKPTQRIKDALPKRRGYAVKGDDLLGMIWDLLTDGADPTGDEFARPLMPEHDGRLALHFGRSHHERFSLAAGHASKVRDVLSGDFRTTFDEVQSGTAREGHHQRCLDALCEKYGTEDWQQFVPTDLRAEVPGRLKHETTITESFNKADSTTLGPDLTWTETLNNLEVVGNACRSVNTTATFSEARAESDLSSADHYSQIVLASVSATVAFGIGSRSSVRHHLVDRTYYSTIHETLSGSDRGVHKRINGAFTYLGNGGALLASGVTLQCRVSGSSIEAFANGLSWLGPFTDTAISGGTRTGIGHRRTTVTDDYLDAFEAADLVASGINYTQLERGTRGILRGVYTRY